MLRSVCLYIITRPWEQIEEITQTKCSGIEGVFGPEANYSAYSLRGETIETNRRFTPGSLYN
jgi:hypothetical protein